MKKKSKISLGLIFILLILICATVLFVKTKINKKTVFKTEKISQGDVTQSVTTTGTVNPVVDVLVGTRVSGTITKIYVDFNSVVKKNQVIAIVDPAPFQIALEQANASLLQAQANLASAQASFANAQLTMGEDQQLYKNNYIAKSDLDAATTTYNTTKANVLAAQA